MSKNVAETIKSTTKNHLENGGLLFSQCVTAVGWIGGTVPDTNGIEELPTSDVSNSGIVVGAGLANRRPIYVIRYQGFMWYNAASLLNYAAKSKEMWGIPCPVFVRSLGMEGNIGPVASGMFHSLVMHMPGMPVAAPITPFEWLDIWNFFMSNDCPVYCSEHRQSFQIDYEIEDIKGKNIVLFGISISRIYAKKAAEKMGWSMINIVWLKPFEITNKMIEYLENSEFGVVLDCGYTICGASQSLAYELMAKTGKKVYALGLDDRTAGFGNLWDNKTASVDKIINFCEKVR